MQDWKIEKYLSGTTSPEEEQQVENWIISSKENASKFNLLKARYIASTLDENTSKDQVDRGYATFSKAKSRTSISKYGRLGPILKYAAIVMLILGAGYTYTSGFFKSDPAIIISDDAITLELENGNIEVIAEDGTAQVVDAKGNLVGVQKGSQLIYSSETATEKLVYNTITVPYGKRFDVILTDGTHVFLNTGTSFRYPVNFIKGENREVFLNGEAYFEVTKDAHHPFVVNMDDVNVKVLGTSFNISSYPEDEIINTTLVEGSVQIYGKEDSNGNTASSMLEPGHKAAWDKIANNISIEEADVAIHTAWVNGKIVLRHLPFHSIVKKLERHYNVTIVNKNEELRNERFTASFDTETIDQVLNTFSKTYDFEYTILNDEIIIN